MTRILEAALREITGTAEPIQLGVDHGLSKLLADFDLRWGERAARGIAHRVGAACFIQVVRASDDRLGLTQPAFRMLPPSSRLSKGLEILEPLFLDLIGGNIAVEHADGILSWRSPHCPACAGREASAPVCYLVSGLLREAVGWLAGGKSYEVRETACRACGDPDCRFVIEPLPAL